jgi:hypothetical protein
LRHDEPVGVAASYVNASSWRTVQRNYSLLIQVASGRGHIRLIFVMGIRDALRCAEKANSRKQATEDTRRRRASNGPRRQITVEHSTIDGQESTKVQTHTEHYHS